MTQILFDGLTFDDTAKTGYTIGSWAGWWDGPPTKTTLTERSVGDGAAAVSRVDRAQRPITVNGSYVGSGMADTYAALRRLAALQANGVPSTFRVIEPFSDLQCVVTLVGAPTMPQQLAYPYFTFTFHVAAADPYLYGPAQTVTAGAPASGGGLVFPLGTNTPYWDFGADGTSGRVSVTNTGTADMYPLLSVTGGCGSGFTITDITSGVVVPFSRLIPVGSTVTVNMRTGRAWIDDPSNDVSGYLTAPDSIIRVPAGQTHLIQFSPLGTVTGSPAMSVQTAAPNL